MTKVIQMASLLHSFFVVLCIAASAEDCAEFPEDVTSLVQMRSSLSLPSERLQATPAEVEYHREDVATHGTQLAMDADGFTLGGASGKELSHSNDAEEELVQRGGTPWLLFAMGPTGSGKSGLEKLEIDAITEQPGMKQTQPKMMLIDDYVEKDPYYKESIKLYLGSKLNAFVPSIQEIQTFVSSADETTYNEFETRYFNTRTSHGCKEFCQKKQTKCGCDNEFDHDLLTNLKNGENIVFETTAENYRTMQWVASEVPSANGYKVVAAATYVPFCDLLERNSGRAASAIRSFLEDPETNDAPRLPSLEDLAEKVTRTLEVEKFVAQCAKNREVSYCTDVKGNKALQTGKNDIVPIDQFTLYDNSKAATAGDTPGTWKAMTKVATIAGDTENKEITQVTGDLESMAVGPCAK